MYQNYGDRNFFEYGCLVDPDHSDTEFPMILCRPYDDTEDLFQFNMITVDITDSWIDKSKVMSYIGMTEEEFDRVQFAIGCTEYYSWDNWGQLYDANWLRCDRKYIEDVLRHQLIATDNLDVSW